MYFTLIFISLFKLRIDINVSFLYQSIYISLDFLSCLTSRGNSCMRHTRHAELRTFGHSTYDFKIMCIPS